MIINLKTNCVEHNVLKEYLEECSDAFDDVQVMGYGTPKYE